MKATRRVPGTRTYKSEVRDEKYKWFPFFSKFSFIDCLSSASTFRQGSVVVSFNVSYAAVDALQIVTMQEQIESGGTLGGSPAVLINISSNYGKEVLNTQPTLCEAHYENPEQHYLT